MGLYNNTYFGPFLVVKDSEREFTDVVYETTSGKRIAIISKESQSSYEKKRHKFDPQTGEPIISRDEKIIKPVKGIDRKFLDNLCSDLFIDIEGLGKKNETIYVLNKSMINMKSVDEHDIHILPNGFNTNDCIEEFYKLYSKELVEITKEGYEYNICWGIVNYQA